MRLLADLRRVTKRLRMDGRSTFWAILVLAMGIGSTAAVFGIVNAVLLRPLPYTNPKRLAVLWQTDLRSNQDIIPWGNLLDYQKQSHIFRDVAAFGYWTPVLTNKGHREPIIGADCSPDLFTLLGVSPLLGRTFLPHEQGHRSHQVVILSYWLWKKDYGADPRIIGKNIVFEEFGHSSQYTIVGVMPPGFDFPYPLFKQKIAVWTPIGLGLADASRKGNQVYAVGRLQPNISLSMAQTQLDILTNRLAQEFPDTNRGVGVRLVPLAAQLVHNVKPMLLSLSAAVGFILLLSCASVAGLILAHAVRGSKESALCAALGAKNWYLMRPPIIEGLLLATLGGVFGLCIAQPMLKFGLSQISIDILGPRMKEAQVNGPVLAFGLLLALLCGLGAALVAAVRSCKIPLNETLKQEGQSASTGQASLTLQTIFVVIQIAAAFALLTGTSLMIRSFLELDREKLGFNPTHLLTFDISLPNSLAVHDKEIPVLDHFLAGVRSLPGVKSAALVDSFPLNEYPYTFLTEGETSMWKPAQFHPVSPSWFKVLGLQIISGRTFTDADNKNSQRVMVVNQTMAHRFWPGESPIGKQLIVRPSRWHPLPEYTVIGEVSSTRPFGGGRSSPTMFVPFAQFAEPASAVVVRTKVSPSTLIRSLRALVLQANPDAIASNFTTATAILAQSTQKPLVAAKLLGILAIIALVIAAVGIYSVLSVLLRLQMRSVAIRLALGAPRRNIVVLFLKVSCRAIFMGVISGLALSLLFDRFISSLLYGVTSVDPVALGVAGLVVLAACLIATLPLAYGAACIEPSVILKEE